MEPETDWVTVYRSGDHTAEEDAAALGELLSEAGIRAAVLGDDTPGVIEGTWEVRVPVADAARAEGIIEENCETQPAQGDASPELDLVTLFRSDRHDAEMEALAIRAVLDANEIPSVIVGTSLIASLPFEVRVPRVALERAQKALQESQEAGPEAAEEAAASSGDEQP